MNARFSRSFPLQLSLLLLVASLTASAVARAAAKADTPNAVLVTEKMGHPHIGDPAPDFALTARDGTLVKLSSYQGSVVMLALVASWCPYSEAEQAHLPELAAEYAPRGVKFLAVVVADDDKGYAKYCSRVALPFPVLQDKKDLVALGYAPDKAQPFFKARNKVAVTSNLVLDEKGVIRYFGLVDTSHFDANFSQVRAALERLVPAKSTT
jgi:peroxiredoxin Q/BCP